MPSAEDNRVIIAADTAVDIDNISVSRIRTAENSVYHVEYDHMNLLLHKQFYISPENGFVIRQEIREKSGALTYNLGTSFI